MRCLDGQDSIAAMCALYEGIYILFMLYSSCEDILARSKPASLFVPSILSSSRALAFIVFRASSMVSVNSVCSTLKAYACENV